MVLFWSWGLEKTLAGELSKHISFFFQEQVFSPAVKVLARMLVLHICMAGKLRERERKRESYVGLQVTASCLYDKVYRKWRKLRASVPSPVALELPVWAWDPRGQMSVD